MSAPDGGPAFPRVESTDYLVNSTARIVTTGGMSLRDWFAGQAIQGILANGSPHVMAIGAKEAAEFGETRTEQTWSRWAYEIADAMLRERAKP